MGRHYSRERVYFSAGAVQTVVWSGENGGLVGRAEVGLTFVSGLRLGLGYDVPIAGGERFRWRGRLGVQRCF